MAFEFNLPVGFKNLNVGEKTCRLGCTIDRGESLTVTQADKNLCERRLSVRIIAKPSGSQADQEALPGMDDDLKLDGVCDVKGVQFTGDTISIGLTFNIKDMDIAQLSHFAGRAGRLQIKKIEDIPEPEKKKKQDSDEEPEGGDEE